MSIDLSPAPTRPANPDKETKGPWMGAFDPIRADCFGFLEKVLTYGAVLKAHRWLKYDQVDALEKQGFITIGERRTQFSHYAVSLNRGALGAILGDPERAPVLDRIIAITSMGGKKTGRERIETLRAAGVEFDESMLLADPNLLGSLALAEVSRLKTMGVDYEAMIAERDSILQQGLRDAWENNSLGLVAAAAGGPSKKAGQVVTQYLSEYTEIHGNTDEGLRDEVMSLFAIALKSRSALKRMRQSMTTFGDVREFTKAMEDEAPSSRMIDAGYRPSLGGIVAYLQACCLKPCKALVREHLESGIHGPSLDYLAANGVDFYQDGSGSVRTIRQSKGDDDAEVEHDPQFGEKKEQSGKKKVRFLPESKDREDLLLLQHAAQQLKLPDAGDYFSAATPTSRFVGMRSAAIRIAEALPDFEGKEDAIAELRGDPMSPDDSPGWNPAKYPLSAWVPELSLAIEAMFPMKSAPSLADEKVRDVQHLACHIARLPLEAVPTEFAAAEEHLQHADRAAKLGALWRTRTVPDLLNSHARPDFVLLAAAANLPLLPPPDEQERNRLMREMAEKLFSEMALGFVNAREHILAHIQQKWDPSKDLLGSALNQCLLEMRENGIMTPSEVQLADTLYRDKEEDRQLRADIRDADRTRRLKVQREINERAAEQPVEKAVQEEVFGGAFFTKKKAKIDPAERLKERLKLWQAAGAASSRVAKREEAFIASQQGWAPSPTPDGANAQPAAGGVHEIGGSVSNAEVESSSAALPQDSAQQEVFLASQRDGVAPLPAPDVVNVGSPSDASVVQEIGGNPSAVAAPSEAAELGDASQAEIETIAAALPEKQQEVAEPAPASAELSAEFIVADTLIEKREEALIASEQVEAAPVEAAAAASNETALRGMDNVEIESRAPALRQAPSQHEVAEVSPSPTEPTVDLVATNSRVEKREDAFPEPERIEAATPSAPVDVSVSTRSNASVVQEIADNRSAVAPSPVEMPPESPGRKVAPSAVESAPLNHDAPASSLFAETLQPSPNKPTKFALECREGVHDKVYGAEVVEESGGFVVNFWNGRRGGQLRHGTKTEVPVSRAEAEDLMGKLLKEKLRKGYVHQPPAEIAAIEQQPRVASVEKVSQQAAPEPMALGFAEEAIPSVTAALDAVDLLADSPPIENFAKKQASATIPEVQPNFEQLNLFDLYVAPRTPPAHIESLDMAKASDDKSNPEIN